MADGAQQLPAHLLDGPEHVLDPCASPGDAFVALLLALGQRLVAFALSLDLVAVLVRLQPVFALFGRIAPVGIHVTARVARVEHVVEMLTVVRAGRIGLDPADDLVLLVDVDRQLVTEVTLAVLLDPGSAHALVAPFFRAPRGRLAPYSISSFSLQPLCCLGAGTSIAPMIWPPRDERFLEQLFRDPIENGLRAGFTDPVLESPHGGAIRHVRGVRQPTKVLLAHAIEQLVLHLLNREVVQALEDQNSHHRLRRIRRSATQSARRPRRYPINLSGQGRKVDVRFDLGQRIAQRVDVPAMVLVGKQVSLDGAS